MSCARSSTGSWVAARLSFFLLSLRSASSNSMVALCWMFFSVPGSSWRSGLPACDAEWQAVEGKSAQPRMPEAHLG